MIHKFEEYEKIYNTLHEATIRYAFDKGYMWDFEKCHLQTPNLTFVKPKLYGKQRYPSITINSNQGNKRLLSFHIHRFVAYQLYGEDVFKNGVNVRHLDANVLNLSKSNIVLGTSQENQFDKSDEKRNYAAKVARKSQGIRPVTSKIPESLVPILLKEYFEVKGKHLKAPRGSVKALAEKYGFSKVSIQAVCSGHSFNDLYMKFIKEKE